MIACFFISHQRHTLRDRRSGTTACPACWAMGTNDLKLCTGRKKNILLFVLGRPEQPRQNKYLLYQHEEPIEPTKEGLLPFVYISFNSQQGPPPPPPLVFLSPTFQNGGLPSCGVLSMLNKQKKNLEKFR
jgi:hypothetical protein